MSVAYSSIVVLTGEEVRWKGRPLHEAVVEAVRRRKLAARCLVLRAISGCYESGEVATHTIVDLSANLPLEIRIVLPTAEVDALLAELDPMVSDGMILVHEAHVRVHRTSKRLFPRGMRVRDAMTPAPTVVTPETPVSRVARLLVQGEFGGLPVVDDDGRVQGIITEADLVSRGGMPLRVGLLADLDAPAVEATLAAFEALTAQDVMTPRPRTVRDDDSLEGAADRMTEHDLKRMPVTDGEQRLVGMLSRVDLLRVVSRESDHWPSLPTQVEVRGGGGSVGELVTSEVPVVAPHATLGTVLALVESRRSQRVAVVGEDGLLLGMVSDRDVLAALKSRQPGRSGRDWWPLSQSRHAGTEQLLDTLTAAELVTAEPITIAAEASIEQAAAVMTAQRLKRLPVVDAAGRYLGTLSRDAILRAGLRTY